jgi:hypothetical protein
MNDDVSYDRLNALVDGQLDGVEAGRVFDAIHRDPGLERRVGELRLIKDLVRHAYRHESSPGSADRHPWRRDWRSLAVAAVALVAVGIGAGWNGHAWQQRDGDADLSRLAHRAGAVAQVAADNRVVLHLSSSAPERVSAMLDDAEGMLRASRASGRPIAIEILANNTGLDVLRVDVPGPSVRLASLRAENPSLTLVACGQTIERLRERGVVVQLLPRTVVATSALDEVVKRIHEGWTYVRT